MNTDPNSGLQQLQFEGLLYLTGEQLQRFNAESIRLEFSRNLTRIDDIPDEMNAQVVQAFRHFSCDSPPLQNIRLVIALPNDEIPADWRKELGRLEKSLAPNLLDITNDAWKQVMGNPSIV